MSRKPRQVVCAAIRHKGNGQIICAPRHHHCIKIAHQLGIYESGCWEQGFVDQKMEYLSRKEALQIAIQNKQVKKSKREVDSELLFSEDLY